MFRLFILSLKLVLDVILNDAHANTNSSLVTQVLVHQVLEKRLVQRMQPSKMREPWFLKILMNWETQSKECIGLASKKYISFHIKLLVRDTDY